MASQIAAFVGKAVKQYKSKFDSTGITFSLSDEPFAVVAGVLVRHNSSDGILCSRHGGPGACISDDQRWSSVLHIKLNRSSEAFMYFVQLGERFGHEVQVHLAD